MHLFAVLKEQIKNQVYLYLQVEGPPQNHAHSGDLGFFFFYGKASFDLSISTTHCQESRQKPCMKVKRSFE